MTQLTTRGRAAVACVVTGLVLAASIPPIGWWPLGIVGIALLDWLLDGQAPIARFRRTFLALIALFLPTMFWMQYLTLPGWLIASAFFPALFGLGMAALPPSRAARWCALPGVWVLVDALRGRWPFGGVPLSTLAHGQVAGPLGGLARVGGALLLTGVTAVAGVGLAAMTRRAWRPALAAVAFVVVGLAVAVVAPRGHDTGPLRVAIVQGGGPTGHRDVEADNARVFQAHVTATALVHKPVDLVVWPEDVVDVDGPVTKTPEGRTLASLSRRLDATLIAGVVEGYGDHFRNSAIVYEPDGQPGDRYDKVRRVPFGEYTPLRSILDHVAGNALIKSEAFPGHDPATLDTPVGRLGVVISWEVFFGDRARNAIGHGGEILLNPTNGATFRGTQVQAQQLASSKLRAIETGRWVLQAAPTGYSAIVSPGGHVVARTSIGQHTVLQRTVTKRSGQTFATRVGDWLALGLAAAALAAGWLADRHATATANPRQ